MMNLAKALFAGIIGVAALSGVNHAQTQSQPVKNIVLVHGAFADGTSWRDVIPILKACGFHVVAVQNPLTSLADDANATPRPRIAKRCRVGRLYTLLVPITPS